MEWSIIKWEDRWEVDRWVVDKWANSILCKIWDNKIHLTQAWEPWEACRATWAVCRIIWVECSKITWEAGSAVVSTPICKADIVNNSSNNR